MNRKTDRNQRNHRDLTPEHGLLRGPSKEAWAAHEPAPRYVDSSTPLDAGTPAIEVAPDAETLTIANDIIQRYRPALQRLLHR